MAIDILPQNLIIRRPLLDDVEAVTALLNASSIAEYGSVEFSAEEIRSIWQGPEFDVTNNAWVVLATGGRFAAYADIEHRENARIYSFVRVYPEFCGLGIGSHLLHLTEERARTFIPFARPDARVALYNSVASVNEKGTQLLEQEGFKLVRNFWDMEIDLREAPELAQWPAGVTVRTFVRNQDERLVFDTMEEAFQDHWGYMQGNFEEWQSWTVKRESFDPTLFFLAFEGNELAGASLCHFRDESNLGWVGKLGVRRPWRRKGLGLALLLHSFDEFYRRGIHKVGLGVDSQNLTGATRLYLRAGMHVARQYSSYEKELRAGVELSTQNIAL